MGARRARSLRLFPGTGNTPNGRAWRLLRRHLRAGDTITHPLVTRTQLTVTQNGRQYQLLVDDLPWQTYASIRDVMGHAICLRPRFLGHPIADHLLTLLLYLRHCEPHLQRLFRGQTRDARPVVLV